MNGFKDWLKEHGADLVLGLASLAGVSGLLAFWGDLVRMCDAYPAQIALVAALSFCAGIAAGRLAAWLKDRSHFNLDYYSEDQLAIILACLTPAGGGIGRMDLHVYADAVGQLEQYGVLTRFDQAGAQSYRLTPKWARFASRHASEIAAALSERKAERLGEGTGTRIG